MAAPGLSDADYRDFLSEIFCPELPRRTTVAMKCLQDRVIVCHTVADLGGYPRYPWIPPFDKTGQRIAQLIHSNFTVYNLPTIKYTVKS